MPELVAVLDFGSQYSQLIARRIRELGVYCEILPHRTSALVELCRDALFSEGAVSVSGPVEAPPFHVAEPLEPGGWYWRVRVPDFGVASAP